MGRGATDQAPPAARARTSRHGRRGRLQFKRDGQKLTDSQARAAIGRVASELAAFYGAPAPETSYEPEYLAAVESDERFHHPGEMLPGVNYGHRILNRLKDPELGIEPLRVIAHGTAHSLSGTRLGPLPGFSHHFEEGACEVLSIWFWHQRGQPLDDRDAIRLHGRWSEGPETLANTVCYREHVEELMRRAASRVGWDRDNLIAEIRRVLEGDHTLRLQFRDQTDPEHPLPADLPATERSLSREQDTDQAVALIRWLTGPPAPQAVQAASGRQRPAPAFATALSQLHRLTLSDVQAGLAPGVRFTNELPAGVAGRANFAAREIELGPGAFEPDGSISSLTAAHEAGHFLVSEIIKDGRVPEELQVFRRGEGVDPAGGRYAAYGNTILFENPFGLSQRPEEMLSDAYAALLHGQAEFSYTPGFDGPDDEAERERSRQEFLNSPRTRLLELVAARARELGLPDRGLYRFERQGDGEYRLALR